ncbi:UDP-N-acetylmuramoyl-tripeptide--D-alanyl-D-alanine ligase [Candidatus Dojkabacteria bacterium]|nr:UDP-N-acetylmuramoyl-tripeptide--D-alanyl-D-alanine ligase [Candidatus Dojkabacteria bacterium]
MKIIEILKNLFFLRSFLYLFQSEEYVVGRFLRLIIRNPVPWNVEKIRRLDWTFRAKLLFVVSVLVFVFLGLICGLLKLWAVLAIFTGFFLVAPWVYIIIAYYIVSPREKINRNIVIRMSRKRVQSLKKMGMKVIGLTGSFGKTSTKHFISVLLEKKFKVYATPKSYNTLFGIAQAKFKLGFVSDVMEYLNEEIEVFLVEMGAYCIGEIEELCRAFPPDFAVLTGITTMHYEKFGSLENTIKAKSEILEGLSDGSKAFLNVSNRHVKEIFDREKDLGRLEVIGYGLNSAGRYDGRIMEMTKDGTRFQIKLGSETVEAQTKLIGTGNITNILGAIAVAKEFGVSANDIVSAVADLEPIESRMQVIDQGTGIVTINNGYSSNPESFKQTLETLKLFEASYKVLVTPGIFELGDIEYKVHEKLGSLVTDDINLVILLGKEEDNDRIRGLRSGLKKAGYPDENIVLIKDIASCYDEILARNLIPSVVVLENDLPDIYNI